MKEIKKSLNLVLIVFCLVFFTGLAYGQGITGDEIPADRNSYTNYVSVQASDIQGDNANAEATGVYADPSLDALNWFENYGSISAVAEIGNVYNGNSYDSNAYGVYIDQRDVNNFINEGSIEANATVGSVDSSTVTAYAYGVDIGSVNNSFTNDGTIEATSTVATTDTGTNGSVDSSYVEAYAYGVYVGSISGDFENSGTGQISANVLIGDVTNSNTINGLGIYAYAYGVDIGSVNNFTNSGTIEATTTVGSVDSSTVDAEAYGVSVGSISGDFENSGTISSNLSIGNVSGSSDVNIYSAGAEIWNGVDSSFTNDGKISASVAIGDVSGSNIYGYGSESEMVDGIYISDHVGTFANNTGGEISAELSIGNVSNNSQVNAYTYGVYIDGSVDNSFTNSGTISATSTVATNGSVDSSYVDAEAYGVDIAGSVENFTNTSTGNILVNVKVGDVTSSKVYAYAYDGVEIWGDVGNFTNAGLISVNATVGSVDGSYVDAGAWGIDIYGSVGNFTNSGLISTTVQTGSAIGDNGSQILSYGISGVEIWGNVGSFVNSGDIKVNVKVGDANGTSSFVTTYDENSNTGVYGVYIGNNVNVNKFENTGNILASVVAGNASGENSKVLSGHVLGVDIGSDDYYEQSVGSFTNKGSIEAYAEAGNAEGPGSFVTAFSANPVWVDYSYVNNFENSGNLIATAKAGNATGDNSIVEITDLGSGFLGEVNSFVNSGNIITTAIAGDATGNNSTVGIGPELNAIYGVYFEDSVGNFTNTGNILINAKVGNAKGDNSEALIYAVAGIINFGDVGTFKNTGKIVTTANAGDAEGNYSSVGVDEIYGVYLGGSVGKFENSGSIVVDALAGSAVGNNSWIYMGEVDSIHGVYFANNVADFSNTGLISVSAKAGDAIGNGSYVGVYDVIGAYFDGSVENFKNTGTISATAKAGGALGTDSNVEISGVAGVYFGGDVNATNEGNIITFVKAGKDANISDIAGLAVTSADSANNIVNKGNIYLAVDAPQAQSVSNAAGIYVHNSDVTISNPGAIYLWTNASNADIRTLRIESSTVTLSDKFAVVFGQEGINKPPIYVDNSSTLKLNSAELIARAGNRLFFGQPYYVIENYNNSGAVDGNFGNLLRGYQNPDILVNWYDSNRGENSAVTFSYQPKSSAPALGLHSSIAVVDTITNLFTASNLFSENLLAQTNNKVYFAAASNVANDAISPYKVNQRLENAMFIYPFYGVVNGSNSLKYDATAKGFVAGYEHKFDDYLRLSLFGGYARGDVDFNIKGSNDENQNIYIAGFSLDKIARQESPIYVGLTTIGYHTDHDYSGATGPNYEIPEKANYNSNGLEVNLISGYKFFGNDWEIMPHIGAGLSYWHLNNFNTEALDPNWNRFYDSADNTYGKLMAGLSGVKNWNVQENQIYLAGLLRAQQVIGNNDFSIAQELPYLNSGKVGVTQSISNFSLIGRVELGLKIKKRFLIGLSSGTELNADYKAYDGRLFFSYSF